MAKKELNNTQIVIFYYKIAYVLCKQKSMFDKALLYLDSTKLITSHHNFAKYEAQVAMLQSEIFNKQKKYSECLKTIDVAKNIFITINDNEGIVKCFSDKANCLVALGKTNDALLIYKEGIKFSENNSCYLTIPTLLHNIGSLYYDINLDSSELYLTKAILEAKKINDHHILGYAFANLAELDLLQKKYEAATSRMYKALQTFKSIGEYNNVSWLIPRIAHAELLKLETKIQPVTPLVISKIEKLLQEAEVLQQQAIDFVTLETIYDCYIRVGSLQKNTSMQANYLKKLLALKDSVYTNKKLTDGLEIAERLKTTEQQLKIAKLETANTKSNFFNYSLIAILLASIISAIAFYRNYRKQSQLKNQQLLLKQKEAFRNQLAADLHDEVGTLLTGLVMQSEMLIYQPQENSTTKLNEIGSISKEAMEQMREIVWTLDSSKDKYDNLFNKMKYLAEHQLLNKNIEHAFIIETFNSDLEILPEKRQSVYLIFKEAIANILKHSNATFVDIIIKQTKEKTYLTIKDNGTIVAKTISDGLGTNNMRNRANAINAQLSITATDGYKVELIF